MAKLNVLDHHEEDDYYQEKDDQNQEEGDRIQGKGSPRRGWLERGEKVTKFKEEDHKENDNQRRGWGGRSW